MGRYLVNTEEKLQSLIGDLREQWRLHHYLRVTLKTGKDRSMDQNALCHAWYEQLARELREEDALGFKRFCKLTMGVPILRAEDEKFREMYDSAIRKHLTYEQKLKAMDVLPVTSLMTVKQHCAYMTAMQDHFRTRGVQLESEPSK